MSWVSGFDRYSNINCYYRYLVHGTWCMMHRKPNCTKYYNYYIVYLLYFVKVAGICLEIVWTEIITLHVHEFDFMSTEFYHQHPIFGCLFRPSIFCYMWNVTTIKIAVKVGPNLQMNSDVVFTTTMLPL